MSVLDSRVYIVFHSVNFDNVIWKGNLVKEKKSKCPCQILAVICYISPVKCRPSPAKCRLSNVICQMATVTWKMAHVNHHLSNDCCHMLSVTRQMSTSICHISCISYQMMSPVKCHLPPVNSDISAVIIFHAWNICEEIKH